MISCGRTVLLATALTFAGCTGDVKYTGPGGADADLNAPDGGAGLPYFDELDKDRAQESFPTTTELMRYVFSPGCAAEVNECHSNEDYPDMHTEGNVWNLRMLPCNVGVGERDTVEDFCEQVGDQIRVTGGENADFITTIASIVVVSDDEGNFLNYEVKLKDAPPASQTGASWELLRSGNPAPSLGGGNDLELAAGATVAQITDDAEVTDPALIKQGDENGNGVFGAGTGVIVRPGNARDSYMVRRLLGADTSRIRMPLNENADNPTELNRNLSPDEMYAIMSWINCMQEGDGPASPIRYDCPENEDNNGDW